MKTAECCFDTKACGYPRHHRGSRPPHCYQQTGGRATARPGADRTMVEQRKRYRDKKEPKKAETRRPCTRLSVNECQRTLHTVVCLVMMSVVTAEVPEYRHLRSNHIYSYRQKIALLILREYLDLPYRRMYEIIGGNPIVTDVLGMDFFPHHSTLAKFSKSVDAEDLKAVVCSFQVLLDQSGVAALDGTYLSDRRRSAHYERRLRDFGVPQRKPVFTKASIVSDVETKIILAAEVFCGRKHDVTFVPEMVRQLQGCRDRLRYLVADKGYDCERIHFFVRKQLGARFLAPCKGNPWMPVQHIGGHFRRKMKQFLGPLCSIFTRIYHMRAIVETTNSMLKKVFGSTLRAVSPEGRRTESFMRIIAHNIRQTIALGKSWVWGV